MSTKTLELRDEENKIGNTPIEAATAKSLIADMWFRGFMVFVVSLIFVWLNQSVMAFIYQAFARDNGLPPGDRLISPQVVMALIGATVVQTGIGFIAITSYLFPKRGK